MSRTSTPTINYPSRDKEVSWEMLLLLLIMTLSKLFKLYPNLWQRIQTGGKECDL